MGINRRAFVASSAMASILTVARPALGQSNIIRVIHPYAPGAGSDAATRYLAEQMRIALGQPVVVENRVGADGRIGVRATVEAAPDGKTFLFTPLAPIVVQPLIYDKLPYNPLTDLAPVAQACSTDVALSTGPMTNARNLDDLKKWLIEHKQDAAFGSPASGSIPHFSGILFANAAKVELRHVPYRGSSPLLNDLVAGQVALASTSLADVVELHKSGALKILATTGEKRSSIMPDVPTYREQGYDIVAESWFAMYAPAGTPLDIVKKVEAIVIDAVKKPEGKEFFHRLGLTPTGRAAAELAEIQKRDALFWAEPIKQSGFKASE